MVVYSAAPPRHFEPEWRGSSSGRTMLRDIHTHTQKRDAKLFDASGGRGNDSNRRKPIQPLDFADTAARWIRGILFHATQAQRSQAQARSRLRQRRRRRDKDNGLQWQRGGAGRLLQKFRGYVQVSIINSINSINEKNQRHRSTN